MTRSTKRLLLAAVIMACSAFAGLAQDIKLDVPYVPTKYPVVDEMLRMAAVTKNDIVYDLGCGDGRLVITAAQKFGARGVGYDIDPERIKECLENAKSAGVMDKVKFILGDLFQADFHEATVIPMYLLPSVNLKLRPKILRELRPGSRVVSHDFSMGDWQPDDHTSLEAEGISHDVYYWVVPANISGAWTWTSGSGPGAIQFGMDVTQKFQVPDAKVTVNGAAAVIKEMKLVGDQIRFTVESQIGGKAATLTLDGKASNHQITGSIKGEIEGRAVSYPWNAARKPGSETRIDDDMYISGSGPFLLFFNVKDGRSRGRTAADR